LCLKWLGFCEERVASKRFLYELGNTIGRYKPQNKLASRPKNFI
jgi:hypothetical protein